MFSFSVCNIEQSYLFSRCFIYILQLYQTCLSFLNPHFEPLTKKLNHPVTSVVLIHIRQYHVSVEVIKRLIYYLSGLSGHVHVHVVFVFVQSV